MRRLIIAIALACTLCCSGCALSDLMYSLFGGMNSNEADMNAKNSKNNVWLNSASTD